MLLLKPFQAFLLRVSLGLAYARLISSLVWTKSTLPKAPEAQLRSALAGCLLVGHSQEVGPGLKLCLFPPTRKNLPRIAINSRLRHVCRQELLPPLFSAESSVLESTRHIVGQQDC